ncbi:MAG: hypothetical protein IJ106_00740 [Parasporobacterium sp.]|nr:hypothetical protein [Parasporobacterium sp.]
MLKALVRKQFLEIRNLYLTGRGGKKKQLKSPKGMYFLLGFLAFIIMVSMFFASMGVGDVLIPAGLDWMFFAVMCLIAFLLGIIGSVMSTAQALFRSRDNELLLSMPIPPAAIVFVRMISVYIMSLIYEGVVLIPAVIYYFIFGQPSFLSVVFCILGIFLMGFLITAFSCGAGWLVSLIAAKLKNQKIILVIMGVILIGAIYYVQFNSSRLIRSLVENAETVAERIRGWGYPLYAPGLSMTGNVPAFLVFLGITAVLFGIAYYAVSKSFSKIALMKETEKFAAFRKTDIRTSGVMDTLFRRELRRFTSSVPYMMNAGLGILFLVALGVIALIKFGDIREVITGIGSVYPLIDSYMPVALACAVCLLSSFCMSASCSISMEGKFLWIYQTLPLDPYRIFQAKIRLHLVLAGVPALFCLLVLALSVGVSIPAFVCMLVFTGMYIMLTASFELMLDLKRPKLNWINENQALKTNVTVFIDMLIGVLLPVALGALYLLLITQIGPELYLAILIAVFAGLTLLVHRWLTGKGRRIFQTL